MWIYYFIFVITAISAFLMGNNKKYAIITFIVFSLFYVFRTEIGTDYAGYVKYFNDLNSLNDLSVGGFEPGYNFLALIFRFLGLPFRIFYICINTFIITLFYQTTKKLKLELGITLLLALYFIFYPTLEALRQGVAIILFFYSLTFDLGEEKNNGKNSTIKFFLLNTIGFCFHRTAIIGFIYYFFKKSYVYKLGIIFALGSFMALQPVILKILSQFPAFYNRYSFYIFSNADKKIQFSFSLGFLEYIVVFFVLLYINVRNSQGGFIDIHRFKNPFKKQEYIGNKLNSIERISLNLVELGIAVTIFIGPFIGAGYRLTYYCGLGLVCFYAIILERIKSNHYRIIYVFYVVLYIAFRLGRIFPFENDAFVYHLL